MANKYYSIKEDDLSDIPLVKDEEKKSQSLIFYHGVNKKQVQKNRKKKKLNKRGKNV